MAAPTSRPKRSSDLPPDLQTQFEDLLHCVWQAERWGDAHPFTRQVMAETADLFDTHPKVVRRADEEDVAD